MVIEYNIILIVYHWLRKCVSYVICTVELFIDSMLRMDNSYWLSMQVDTSGGVVKQQQQQQQHVVLDILPLLDVGIIMVRWW